MSNKDKHLQKELRQPDPLQVRLAELLNAILANSKILLAISLGGAVLVGGYYLYENVQRSIRLGRVEELGKIQVVYTAEEKKASDQRQEIQKKIEGLASKTPPTPEGAAAPNDAKPENALSPEKEAEKKDLTQKMEAIKADHSESQKQFEDFYKKYGDKPEGWAAALVVAKILVEKEKLVEAKSLYEELVPKTQSEPFYQIQVRLGLIGLYEEQGDFDKGLNEVEFLIGLLGGGKETSATKQAQYAGYTNDLLPRVLLKKAQIQIFKGQKSEAAQTLAMITEKHGASPQAQKARNLKIMVQ